MSLLGRLVKTAPFGRSDATRKLGEPAHLALNLVGFNKIIGIEKLDKSAVRCLKRAISCDACSGICLSYQSDTAELFDLADRSVFRAVVDHNYFDLCPCLPKYGLKRLANILFGVITRD